MRKTWKKLIAVICAATVFITGVNWSVMPAEAVEYTAFTEAEIVSSVLQENVSTNSEETASPASNLFTEDGTWHSNWSSTNNGQPSASNKVWIQTGFDEVKIVSKLSITPVPADGAGYRRINQYEISVANLSDPTGTPEETDFRIVKTGNMTNQEGAQDIVLDAPVAATHIRISIISMYLSYYNNYATGKRIQIYELQGMSVLKSELGEKIQEITSRSVEESTADDAGLQEKLEAAQAVYNSAESTDDECQAQLDILNEIEFIEYRIDDEILAANATQNSANSTTAGTGDGPAANAFDDDADLWHGNYGSGTGPLSPSDEEPVYMYTGFGEAKYVSKFYYESRDSRGKISKYDISVANLSDASTTPADEDWEVIYAEDNEDISSDPQILEIRFERPVLATHIKLTIYSTTGTHVQVKRIKLWEKEAFTVLAERIQLVEAIADKSSEDEAALDAAKAVYEDSTSTKDLIAVQVEALDMILDRVPVTGIELNTSELNLKYYEGFEQQVSLSATVAPNNAGNKELTWTTDNEAVATVDENGVVTVKGEGTATITVASVSNPEISDMCTVNATFVSNLALNKSVSVENATVTRDVNLAVDGKYTNYDAYMDWAKANNAYFQVDLGSLCDVELLKLYRYWNGGRTYHDTVIVMSETLEGFDSADTRMVVYNADATNVLGFGEGSDTEYSETSKGLTVSLDEAVEARYVRVYMMGSTANDYNHIVEFGVFGNVLAGFTTGSLTLEGNIGLNFKASIDDSVAEGAYVQFVVGDTTSEKIMAADCMNGSDYKFTYEVCADEMTEDVTAKLFLADGTVVSERTFSVQDYASYVINDATASDELKALVKSMLNYGAYAQVQFGNESEAANSILSETDAAALAESMTNVTADVVKASTAPYAVSNTIEAFTKVSSSLILESETTLRHYFTVGSGKTLDDFANYTFKVGETSLAAAMKENDSRIYVDIENIPAKELNQSYVLTVSDGTNTTTVTCSAMNYVYAVLSNTNAEESLTNLVKALYLYNQAANGYFTE